MRDVMKCESSKALTIGQFKHLAHALQDGTVKSWLEMHAEREAIQAEAHAA
jgi:hypothetical protein